MYIHRITCYTVYLIVQQCLVCTRSKPCTFPLGDIDSSEQLSGGSVTEKFNLQIHRVIPLHDDKQHELKQVHCVLLRFITQLKVIYHLYRYSGVP